MTAGSPVRKLSGNGLALLLASALLIPSVFLFCAVHKPADQSPVVLATGLAVRVDAVYSVKLLRSVSYDASVPVSLVQEQAEQNTPAVAQNVQQQLWEEISVYNDRYDGLSASWGDDIVSNLFSNTGQLLAKFLNEMPLQAALILSGFLCLWTAGPVIVSKL
jgi:hypothetical protein